MKGMKAPWRAAKVVPRGLRPVAHLQLFKSHQPREAMKHAQVHPCLSVPKDQLHQHHHLQVPHLARLLLWHLLIYQQIKQLLLALRSTLRMAITMAMKAMKETKAPTKALREQGQQQLLCKVVLLQPSQVLETLDPLKPQTPFHLLTQATLQSVQVPQINQQPLWLVPRHPRWPLLLIQLCRHNS
jgi:hypothetical protein